MSLFFESPIEAIVSISDTDGNLVDVCNYQSPTVVSIPIEEGEGTFELSIEYGSNHFVGQFELR